jgi:hypothetical protein
MGLPGGLPVSAVPLPSDNLALPLASAPPTPLLFHARATATTAARDLVARRLAANAPVLIHLQLCHRPRKK